MIDRAEYALWHGWVPMGRFLRERLSWDRLLVEGRGISVRDTAGRWYIDARSSLWNLSLGYDNAKVKEAIHRQLETLPYGALLTYDRPPAVSVEYANALAKWLPAGLRRIRFGTNGSQMTEGALLLSRFYRRVLGNPHRTAVISLLGAYHGTGPGALMLSGLVDWHPRCGPLIPDVHHVSPEGDWVEAVRRKTEELGSERVTAVIVEPLMGITGIVPRPEYLTGLADFCRNRGIHLIVDEVTTGFGRVGDFTRCGQLEVVPDMLVLGKGITAGYMPASALAVSEDIYLALFEPASNEALPHGSTNDGNPLAMAAGLAVLDILENDGVLRNGALRGQTLREALEDIHQRHLPAGDVDGVGLMLRFPLLDHDGDPWPRTQIERLRLACEDEGLLISEGFGCVLLLPPLIVTDQDCEEIAYRLGHALTAVRRASSATR